ncbi:hypothetical protein D3C72_1581640 [compost metagenome]
MGDEHPELVDRHREPAIGIPALDHFDIAQLALPKRIGSATKRACTGPGRRDDRVPVHVGPLVRRTRIVIRAQRRVYQTTLPSPNTHGRQNGDGHLLSSCWRVPHGEARRTRQRGHRPSSTVAVALTVTVPVSLHITSARTSPCPSEPAGY